MILHTILSRPYVVLFLLAYLFLSWRQRGLTHTLIFLVTGYGIAWVSEALSIRTGFPYGWYFYIHENLQGEWLNHEVPVWDSVSYVFLSFAGMSVGRMIMPVGTKNVGAKNFLPLRTILKSSLLSAFFVFILDIIIDPLANLGDQWFLGKIYYYKEPGFYFGVPLSNFIGWFFVSFLIIGLNLYLEKKWPTRCTGEVTSPLPTLFYFSIFLFNWIITLWIHQWLLAFVDILWIFIPGCLTINHFLNSPQPPLNIKRGSSNGKKP